MGEGLLMSDQQWMDKFAIQELIYGHADAITRGDLGALEALYAPDAIWEHSLMGLRFESVRALCDYVADATATAELLIMTANNPVVHLLDENTARATTTMFELSRGRLPADDDNLGAQGDEISVALYGVYYDDVSKRSGKWLFTHRRYVACYVEQGAASGIVPTSRSSLLAP
jgi:hypothetical protein